MMMPVSITIRSGRRISAVILTGFLLASGGMSLKAKALDSPLPPGERLAQAVNIPNSIRRAVLAEASEQWGQPVNSLRIVNAQARTWSNGCLDLPTDGFCSQALVEGWEVTVEGNAGQRLTYRTDQTGNTVRLVQNSNSGQAGEPSRALVRAVIRDLGRRTNVAQRSLTMVESTRQTWPDSCLGLTRSGEFCSQATVEGWRLRLTDGQQNWFYRTDLTGNLLRLEELQSAQGNFPNSLSKRILADVSRRSNLPPAQLSIVETRRQVWPDGCLGLGEGPCTLAQTAGWEVVVGRVNGAERWVYRTDESGSNIRLAQGGSINPGTGQLPNFIATQLIADLSAETRIPTNRLSVVNSVRQTWPNGCLGLSLPNVRCTGATVEGWRVELTDGRNRWNYRTDLEGRVRFLENNPVANANLPDEVAQTVLLNAARRSRLPVSSLRIMEAQAREWSNSCLGTNNSWFCLPMRTRGWAVTVEGEQRRWLYHVDESASQVILAQEQRI